MKKKIAILGAGPAGLSLAYRLLQTHREDVEVTLIEKESAVGGISASFDHDGLHFDYGSHRLHPAIDGEIFRDIQDMLGDDLLKVPRNGRICLLNRLVKFPLTPFDAALHLPFGFTAGIARDTLGKRFRKRNTPTGSFREVLLAGLGETICSRFYFPYAEKLWGLKPEEIAAEQAFKRISNNSVGKIVKKVFRNMLGKGGNEGAFFYYPRTGFGRIFQAYAAKIGELGGKILLHTEVKQVDCSERAVFRLQTVRAGTDRFEESSYDLLFSTIPITDLAKSVRPEVPPGVMKAATGLNYRGMLFHYLILKTERFTPFDAHYFPETEYLFSRISEPKNYYLGIEPKGITGICSEIPCSIHGDLWRAGEDELTSRVIGALNSSGLRVDVPVLASFVLRKPAVYPVYDLDYAANLSSADRHLNEEMNIITLGRQGLFAHDNVHHVLSMGYKAAECLGTDLSWDKAKWQGCREEFKDHVVVD